jgi:hypothetical protein
MGRKKIYTDAELKERRRQQDKKAKATRKEKTKEYKKKWNEANPDYHTKHREDNIEKYKAAESKYKLKNKEKISKYQKEWHKEFYATKKVTRQHLSSKIYGAQRNRSKKRGHALPEYNLEQLREWLYDQPNFEQLFLEWTNSGHDTMLIPSIDRINDDIGYTFSNIQLMTWGENDAKEKAKQKKSR